MKVLAVDTSLAACSAAIRIDGVLAARRYTVPGTGHAEILLPMMEQVRSDCGLEYRELDLLAVTVGPGTFTGVRAGIAAIRGIALVTGTPALALGTLHALAAGAVAGGIASPDQAIFVAVDARRDEVYFQAFGAGAVPVGEPSIGTLADVTALIPHQALVIGSGAPLLAKIANNERKLRASPGSELPDAGIVAALAETLARRPEFRVTEAPTPRYVRPPHVRPP